MHSTAAASVDAENAGYLLAECSCYDYCNNRLTSFVLCTQTIMIKYGMHTLDDFDVLNKLTNHHRHVSTHNEQMALNYVHHELLL